MISCSGCTARKGPDDGLNRWLRDRNIHDNPDGVDPGQEISHGQLLNVYVKFDRVAFDDCRRARPFKGDAVDGIQKLHLYSTQRSIPGLEGRKLVVEDHVTLLNHHDAVGDPFEIEQVVGRE